MDVKQNEKKLSFVLYQEEKSPQYFEIKKNFNWLADEVQYARNSPLQPCRSGPQRASAK